MTLDCGCIEDEEGRVVVFCRVCAAVLPQTIEDDRGRLQLNPAWLQARCTFATGSRVKDIVARKQNGDPTAKYRQYMDHLLAERLTGRPQGIRQIYSLDERRDLEPEARAAYAFYHNQDVVEVGFIHHLFIERFGCSPDGICGDEGMIEIKCLDASTHLKLWEGDESVIEEYKPQIRSGLACTNRAWLDFVSYCPQMLDERDKLYVRRFHRNEAEISALECAVRDFLAEVDRRVAAIQNRGSNGHSGELTAQLTGSLAMLKPHSNIVPIKRKRSK